MTSVLIFSGGLILFIACDLTFGKFIKNVNRQCLETINNGNRQGYCQKLSSYDGSNVTCIDIEPIHCLTKTLVAEGSQCSDFTQNTTLVCHQGKWVAQGVLRSVKREKRDVVKGFELGARLAPKGAVIGGAIGSVFGPGGAAVGTVIGGAIGAVAGFIVGLITPETVYTTNKPPEIKGCPSQPIQATAAKGDMDVKVNLPPLWTSDPEGDQVSLRQVYGPLSGSKFPEGTHTVAFQATDAYKGATYCWMQVHVNVIKCLPQVEYVKNGGYTCSISPYKNVFGSVCEFSCVPGYIVVPEKSNAVECLGTGQWNKPFPKCEPRSCGDPPKISFGNLFCPDGWHYLKLCVVSCYPGFRAQVPFIKCTKSGTWTPLQDCVDVEAPKFPNGCPSDAKLFSGPLKATVEFNWTDPEVTDNSGGEVSLTSDVAKGSKLGVGLHIIKLTASDKAGNTKSCFFRVDISERECPPLLIPSNSRLTCTRGYVEGSECRVTCDTGYEFNGNPTFTCLHNEQWSSQMPTCTAVECSDPPLVDHGSFECAVGNVFRSVCLAACNHGYKISGRSSIQCEATGNWSRSTATCIDNEGPTFPNGCGRNLEKYQSPLGRKTTVQWATPVVTDNSGESITPVGSHASGSVFQAGVTYVTYTATDKAGNVKKCEFTVTVTTLTCPPMNGLYTTDNFLRFRCPNQNVYGAECEAFCTQGFPLRGADKVTCEQQNNVTSPPTMAWTWSPNTTKPECIVTQCTDLAAPVNGALSCYQGNFAKECLLSCQDPWDIPFGNSDRYSCPNDKGIWLPDKVRNCTVRRSPGQMRMLSELSYFTDSCNTSIQLLKEAFIQRLISTGYGPQCKATPSCRVENIQVTCGPLSRRRRRDTWQRYRRQARTYIVRFTFEIVAEYNETGKTAKQAFQEVRDIKEGVYASLRAEADQGHFNIGSLTTHGGNVGNPMLTADCPVGTFFVNKGETLSCVGCGAGYAAAPNATRCQQCPIGSYTESDEATACIECPAGWSTADAGSTSKTDCKGTCKVGHFSEDGFAPCLPCPPGQYQAREGKSFCDLCPASTWTSGGATSLAKCVPADVLLGARSSVTATVPANFMALSLRAYIHLDDLGVANVTFTYGDSNSMLVVFVHAQTAMGDNLPSNSSTTATVISKPSSWSQLLLLLNPTSGQASIIYNKDIILLHTQILSFSISGLNLKITAQAGEVRVGGLFAKDTLSIGQNEAPNSTTCNGDATSNLLTWSPASSHVHFPSICDAVDECLLSPCAHHGTCLNRQGGFECQCQEGWTGDSCQIPPLPCNQYQCQNGGSCVPQGNTYRCVCGAEFSGDLCQHVKVHGGFSEWSSWGKCSATCQGQQQRQRNCTNPKPENGGDDCTGPFSTTRACGQADCPVDGQWSAWAEWSVCSAACGGGNRTRQRSCDSPPPQFGGDPCDEDSEENEVCNTQECPVNGGWSDWNEWTPCSVTCNGGTRSRVRSCNNPEAANGGTPCAGAYNETEACGEKDCPECSRLLRSDTTILVCQEEGPPYFKTCNLTCAPGYATNKIMPQYLCGEQTGYLWNDQTDSTSPLVLPVCSVPQIPERVNIVQYVPMKAGCDTSAETLRSSIEKNMAAIPCESTGCKLTVSVQCGGLSPGTEVRNRRSAESVVVVTEVSMEFENLTDFNDNDTAKEYINRLHSVDQSLRMLVNETEQLYSVDVDGKLVEPDVTSVKFDGGMKCPPGSSAVIIACVPCVPGSYETEGRCELCPKGQYQDESGSTSCKPCPPNTAFHLPGAADISQCIAKKLMVNPPVEHESNLFDKSVIIIIGSVVSVVVIAIVVIVTTIICLKRKQRKAVPESRETDLRENSQGSNIG